MATPPPLIRSSKPFSVEIPEGSNSAKSRRSDVVGSDEQSISAKKPDFKTSDAALLPDLHHEPVSELADKTAHHADTLVLQDLNVHEDAALHPAQIAHEDGRPDENIQNVVEDATRDRTVALPRTDSNPDNLQSITQGALKDNLQTLSDSSLKDNLQAVTQTNANQRDSAIEKSHIKDNIASVSSDEIHSESQGLPKDSLKDRTASESNSPIHDVKSSVAKESVQDNLQELPDNALEDNQQSVDNPAIRDHQPSLDNDSLEDNQQSVDNPAIRDHQPSLNNESLKDNQQAVDNPAIVDNTIRVPSDALEKRSAESDKEHVQDHMAALPDQHTTRKDGPNPGAVNTSGPSIIDDKRRATVKSSGPSNTSAQTKLAKSPEAEKLQAAKLEQVRKMGEFHGRVEALKKTVSGINNLLDELEEKKPEKKL
jgi:hypothetical protein